MDCHQLRSSSCVSCAALISSPPHDPAEPAHSPLKAAAMRAEQAVAVDAVAPRIAGLIICDLFWIARTADHFFRHPTAALNAPWRCGFAGHVVAPVVLSDSRNLISSRTAWRNLSRVPVPYSHITSASISSSNGVASQYGIPDSSLTGHPSQLLR